MKRTSLTALLMLTAWSVASPLQAQGPNNPPPPPLVVRADTPVSEPTFRTLDMDGDGYISRTEVRRGTNLERQFDQLDTDRDGRLSRQELRGMIVIESPGDAAYRRATTGSRQ